MFSENAAPLEIFLFVLSSLGVVVAVGIALDAIMDLRALDHPAAKYVREIAWKNIWVNLYALYVFLVFLVVSGRSMSLPPTDADRDGIPDPISLVLLFLFLGIIIFGLVLVLWLAWTRHNVARFLPDPWDGVSERRGDRESQKPLDEGGMDS